MLALASREARQLDFSRTVPNHDAVFEGIHAALWLGSLWFVAPLLARGGSWADRLRCTLILGVAIPFVLGFLHLLFGVACVAVVAGLLVLRLLRLKDEPQDQGQLGPQTLIALALPTLAALCVAWPALVRPLLQGDSLGYHLPNAAAWVHDHSLWTTTTLYWWFPGASELFAASLFAVAGPLAVRFAGLAALLLLGWRIAEWGMGSGMRPWVGGAIAALTLSSFAIAEQAGSLENDVWLAAFFLEALWVLRRPLLESGATPAVTALVKLTGCLYAVLALAVNRAPARLVLLALTPLALWLARDVILAPGAIIPLGEVFYGNVVQTTIVAHGWEGIVTLGRALYADGPATMILFGAALVSIAFAKDVRLRIAGLASLIIFFIHPFGFDNSKPQLAVGASLRYGAPFLALGGLFVTEIAKGLSVRGAQFAIGGLAAAVAAFGIAHVVGVFWNDATTHGVAIVVILMAVVLLLPLRIDRRRVATAIVSAALVAYAVVLAGSHPLDYYEDWLDGGRGHSTFFHWLARTKPAAVVGGGLLVGSIAATSPTTQAIDAGRDDLCREARRLGALLAVSGDAQSRKSCGPIVFDDGITVVSRSR